MRGKNKNELPAYLADDYQQVTEELQGAMEEFYSFRTKHNVSVKHVCQEIVKMAKDIAKEFERSNGR